MSFHDQNSDVKTNTIVYPFVITMREFCKFLDKRGIKVDPISIANDETSTAIVYKYKPTQEHLKSLLVPQKALSSLASKPSEPTNLDILLWERTNGRILIEKDVGSYWRFIFENQILVKIIEGTNQVFHRTTSRDVGGFPDDVDWPILRFYKPNSVWEFDSIFLGYVFGDGERPDRVVVSGSYYTDQDVGEEDLSCIGSNTHKIAWKLQTFAKFQ